MDEHKKSVAKACLAGAEDGSMTFPHIVATLAQAGFESYAIDLRCSRATYFRPDGDSVALSTHKVSAPVAASFDAPRIRLAIAEAQSLAAGYTYVGFCETIASAGCAGYVVSLLGRRALYVGRTAETHEERFPD